MMIFGSLSAVINGFSLPMFSFIFGEMSDSFGPNSTKDDVVDQALMNFIWFLILGVASFLLSWAQMGCWMYAGEK